MSDEDRPAPSHVAAPAGIPIATRRPRASGDVAWRRQRFFVAAEYSDGPLPSARELIRYREADPEAPRIILEEFRREACHRRQLDFEFAAAENRRAERGQLFALVVILVGLGISALLIHAGHEWAGAAVGGVNLLGMATLFIALRDPEARRDAESRPAVR
jgi:uncharacterized membrane protein